MNEPLVTLEYIGPSGVIAFDATGSQITLIAGRRYQMDAELAAYRLQRDIHHWKRPESPRENVSAAAKE